jgi:hypothetical protein
LFQNALSAALVLVLGLLAGSALADGRHADPGLEALLPTTLGGAVLTVESQAGPELATRSAAFDAFLAELGRSRADFTLASAYAQGKLPAEVGGWRVKGAHPAKLLPAFKSAVQASSAKPLTSAEEVLAERTVLRIGGPGEIARGPLYAYARGDIVLFVQTTKPELAGEAIAKLPP